MLVNASVPLQLDYDEESVMASATDNETRSEFLEEQQNVKMHTPALTYDIPSLPQNVEVTLSGTGCAILQVETLLINGILCTYTHWYRLVCFNYFVTDKSVLENAGAAYF